MSRRSNPIDHNNEHAWGWSAALTDSAPPPATGTISKSASTTGGASATAASLGMRKGKRSASAMMRAAVAGSHAPAAAAATAPWLLATAPRAAAAADGAAGGAGGGAGGSGGTKRAKLASGETVVRCSSVAAADVADTRADADADLGSNLWLDMAALRTKLQGEYQLSARLVLRNTNQHRSMRYWQAFTVAHRSVGHLLRALAQL